jgi:hypothetical protein
MVELGWAKDHGTSNSITSYALLIVRNFALIDVGVLKPAHRKGRFALKSGHTDKLDMVLYTIHLFRPPASTQGAFVSFRIS